MRTLIVAFLIAIAGIGLATTTLHAEGNRTAQASKMDWLSIPEIYTKLETAGYRNIEKIERESGSYEVKATDRNGQRMKLYVHPQTGEIISQRGRDSKRDFKSDSEHSRGDQRNSADCNKRRCRDDLPQPGAPRPATTK